jgi:hypothetical protein
MSTPTSAHVDIYAADNATLTDAIQFGTSGDTSWSFTGQSFRMDIKANVDDAAALLSLTSDAGEIVVDNVTTRLLHFDVPEATLTAALAPGEYVYDFIMYDASTPAVRIPLMHGKFFLEHGVTGG